MRTVFRRLAWLLPAFWLHAAAGQPMSTVPRVDLQRYTGTWYEIARLPNWFQRDCVSDVTARYRLREDGDIDVVNRCRQADGEFDEAQALARVVDGDSNAKLEVSFFSLFGWRPVWGDYWIVGLDPDYRYAVVGTPDRDYAWVLARQPRLPEQLRERADRALRQAGYRPDNLIDTVHE